MTSFKADPQEERTLVMLRANGFFAAAAPARRSWRAVVLLSAAAAILLASIATVNRFAHRRANPATDSYLVWY